MRIAHSDATEPVASSSNATHARSQLVVFLDQVHDKVPDVPEEEVERDIAEAVQAVRSKV